MKATSTSLFELLKTLPFAFKIIWKESWLLFTMVMLFTVFNGLIPTVTIWIAKYTVDATVAVVMSGGESKSIYHAFYIYALQSSVMFLYASIQHLNTYVSTLLGKRLSLSMDSEIMQRLSCFNMDKYDDPEFYNAVQRASAESTGRPLAILGKITGSISSIVTLSSMFLLLTRFYWPLIFVVFISSLPYAITRIKLGRVLYDIVYDRTQSGRVAGFLRSCMFGRKYVPEIISFGLWGHLQKEWRAYTERFLKEDMSVVKRRITYDSLISFTTLAIQTLVILFIIYRGVNSTPILTVGTITMYIGIYSGCVKTLGGFTGTLSGLYSDMLFLTNLIAFRDIDLPETQLDNSMSILDKIHKIDICNVSFKYPGSDVYILKNINLSFKKGKSALIVGLNGAGKTTLIKLLLGLYKPSEGYILVNGIQMQKYNILSLRKQMSVIFQDFIKYPFTALENIGVGKIESMFDIDEVSDAAVKAKVDDVIQSLPLNYNTPLTRQFNNGVDLSLGQWQRICLARLFVRNASVNIFDEPTASLDVKTEANLLKEIATMSADRICILISHRMIRNDIADRIIILKNGQIAEEGSHAHLINLKGEYWKLWSMWSDHRNLAQFE